MNEETKTSEQTEQLPTGINLNELFKLLHEYGVVSCELPGLKVTLDPACFPCNCKKSN